MTPSLVADKVSLQRGQREIVHDVDLAIEPGEIVAVLGPNGAGKSTLLAGLQGTLKPTSGTVRRLGRVVLAMQAPALVNRSARANVELAMSWWGAPRPGRRTKAEEALSLMRASHLSSRPALQLSGGEQRRVHLARTVAVQPDVLLLDEPFSGLDPETQSAVRDDTLRALRQAGGAVVVVLHDRADAWAMADRLAVLLDGRIEADGRPQQLLDSPPTAAVARFLGYDGELSTTDGVLLTRAPHVQVDPTGDLEGVVTSVVPIEDGLRLRVKTSRGQVWARHDRLDVRAGDEVRVRVTGGARFRQSV